MHELPKMQHFHWFSFWQVDEENNGKTKFMPISVKLNQTYGSRSSAKCQVLWHCVSWLGTWVSPLVSFLPSVLISCPACSAVSRPMTKWHRDSCRGAALLPVLGHPAARDKCKHLTGLLVAIVCVLGWELGFQTEWGFKENEPKAGRSLVALN